MAFDPDAYLAGKETTAFDPDAYLAGADKESFLSKLGQTAGQMFKPQIQMAQDLMAPLPGTKVITGAVFKPIATGIDKIQGAIAGSPTAEALTSPFKTALSVGKGIAGALGEGGVSSLDILTGLAGRIGFLLKAPEAVKAVEIAKLQKQMAKLPEGELVKLRNVLTEKFGPVEAERVIPKVSPAPQRQIQAAIPKPVDWMGAEKAQAMGYPIPKQPRPFSLQAGLPAQEQAALDAFRAKLPQGPAKAPTLAPEAVLGPKAAIPTITGEFHGTGRPIDKLSNYPEQSSVNYYGDGFYTTDNISIAQGYSKKGGNVPSIYKVTPKADVKLYDMEQKIPDGLKFKLKTAVGNYTDEVEKASNLRDLYDRVRTEMSSDGFSANDIQETFDSIRYHLEGEGYEGLKHIGGIKTGKSPHNVKIYWTPADRLNISEVKPTIPPIPATGAPIPPIPAPVAPLTPEQKIITALGGAADKRAQQEAIYAVERSRRTGVISGIANKIPGEAGYLTQRAALKGPMEKVEFESIRKNLTQPDIDGIFSKVENSPDLGVWDKFTAKTGLIKLLGAQGGSVPTEGELALLSKVFSKEFVGAVLDKRSTLEKFWAGTENVLNLPRSIMSTLDFSMPLRQGAFLIGRPKQWLPAFRDQFKYAWSENAYDGLMKNIQSRPTYELMKDNGLSLTTTGNIGAREEAFASNLAEQIPIFGRFAKASNRAATGFLNQVRADTFDDLVKRATETGAIKEPGVVKNIANFVNTATGRGGLNETLEKSAGLLNATFFSPRLMASRLSLLNPTYYLKLDPFTRKEALKSLFSFAAAGATTLSLAKAAGADVGIDPRSADFGKIKIGNTRFDIGAGFQQYFVLAARLLSGEMVSSTTGKEFQLGEGYKATTRADIIQRFFESKTAPIASFALGLLKGKTTMGEDFDIPAEIIDRFVPMVTQDVLDLTREWGSKGVLMAVPGVFGVGSQTYGDQVPVKETSKTGTEKTRWKQKPSIGGIASNIMRGVSDTNIPLSEQGALLEEKKAKDVENIEASKIKAQVIETGEPRRFGNKIFYLEKGVMKTKDLSETTESKKEASTKSLTKSVSNELRYLGIPFTPKSNQAFDIDKNIISDMDYKKLSKDGKKAMMNRFILFRQQGNK